MLTFILEYPQELKVIFKVLNEIDQQDQIVGRPLFSSDISARRKVRFRFECLHARSIACGDISYPVNMQFLSIFCWSMPQDFPGATPGLAYRCRF